MHKSRSVRHGAVFFAVLLISGPSLALKAPDGGSPYTEPEQPGPQSEEQAVKPKEESQTSEGAAAKTPRYSNDGAFLPSERIETDSAVSLPVDI